ncbi:MAG: HDIG domain-containing protein [Paludibacteraceae bacterium]|nr:HDIG domain-containing protein [Paludibacteraceae bacterium]
MGNIRENLVSNNYLGVKMISIFAIAGLIIFLLYPSIGKFQYSFEKGKPWQYETLTAPFGFEIQKSNEEITREQDSLLAKDFQPCYIYEPEVEKKCLESFLNKEKKSGHSQDQYASYINKKLVEIYGKGIISATTVEELKKDNAEKIKLKKGQIAKITEVKKLYTTKSAYEEILETAPSNLEKQILRGYDINKYIKENVLFDKETTENLRNEVIKNISLTKGRIQNGEKIIDHGDIITDQTYDVLNSLKQVIMENRGKTNTSLVRLGQFLIIFAALSIFSLYLLKFRKNFTLSIKDMTFMLTMVCLMCAITTFAIKYEMSSYLIPYTILPIVISTFFDTRTALFLHITTVLLCSFIVPAEFEFLFLQISAGMISICTLKDLCQRSQLVKSVCVITLVYFALYTGVILVHERTIGEINWMTYIAFLINGLLLLFAYPLIYIFEKIFGYTSNVTLLELANTNNPLLLKFSETAPGSFQHSMQVSNLAADAASRIGGNAMLARVGALYHDIGKMKNPAFFTENQSKGENPHDEINNEQESARIIISHVKDGLEIAEKNSLPLSVRDFIRTHHAKSKAKYFYNTYKNKHPEVEVDEAAFTYPGPLPFSKETAIVSMCDSVEAASKSLSEHTDKSINDLVEKIIDGQITDGIFKEAPITLHDIEVVKSALKEKLKTIYHTRISYPELNKK